MNYFVAAIAGIAGTAIMTAFIYMVSLLTKKRFKVVKILGTMMTGETRGDKGLSDSTFAIFVGMIAHYLVGIIFGVSFQYLWERGITRPDLLYSLLLGVIYGAFAILVWKLFFKIHPNPPAIPLKAYLFNIFIGHIFFSVGTVLVYQLLMQQF